jgi:hypothetical protein
MKNRDRFVGLRPQDVKVYPVRVVVENGQRVERVKPYSDSSKERSRCGRQASAE